MINTILEIIKRNIIIVILAHGGGSVFLPLFKENYSLLINSEKINEMIYFVSFLPGPISVELSALFGYYLTNSVFISLISLISYIFIPIFLTYYSDIIFDKIKKQKWYLFFTKYIMSIILASLLIFLIDILFKNLENEYVLSTILLTIINLLIIKFKNNQYLLIFINTIFISFFSFF